MVPANDQTSMHQNNALNVDTILNEHQKKMNDPNYFKDIFVALGGSDYICDGAMSSDIGAEALVDSWLHDDLQRVGVLPEAPSPEVDSPHGALFSNIIDLMNAPDTALFGTPILDPSHSPVINIESISSSPITPATAPRSSPEMEKKLNFFPTLAHNGLADLHGYSWDTKVEDHHPPSTPMRSPASVSGKRSRHGRDDEEEPEEVIIKRQRNTDAARRSRAKKVARLENLETKVAELESENGQLNLKVALLESDKNNLVKKENDYLDRITRLEKQLEDAYKALGERAK